MYTTVKCLLAASTVITTFAAVAAREDDQQPTPKDLTMGAVAATVVGAGLVWLIKATENND